MNTLMIVEDEKLIRQGIKVMALRSGVPIQKVIECKNGLEALELLQNQEIDVMITDIRMPKMDGITLVQEMQSCRHKPLTVVISGYDDFSYAVELLRCGVKEYLLKPVEREQIKSLLEKLEALLLDEQVKRERSRDIGCQQLKYYILGKDLSQDEQENIINQMSGHIDISLFEKREYQVACVCHNSLTQRRMNMDDVFYLENIDKHDLLIAASDKIKALEQDELNALRLGISSCCIGLRQLPAAYEQARLGRERAFAQALCVNKTANKTVENIPEITEQIVQLTGTGKMEEAVCLLKGLFYRAGQGGMKPGEFGCAMKNLIRELKETYGNLMTEEELKWGHTENPYVYESIVEYQEVVTAWLYRLRKKISEDFDNDRNKIKMHEAVHYIHDNYRHDLNMAVVSNYVSMNYSLFSYLFKQHTGTNFVTYLKNIRMEEAKKLLISTEMKITEIGQSVGYENDKHFMKLFKGCVGVSPTEYRNNARMREKQKREN